MPIFDDRPSLPPEVYSSLPTKQVAAACLFVDENNEVLLVKPTYKQPWELPGGVVEANESPRAACHREVKEELGLEVDVGPLLAVDYRVAYEGLRGDALRFVFDGGVLSAAQRSAITLQDDELSEWRFVDVRRLDEYVIPAMARRIRACLSSECPAYLEEGTPPDEPPGNNGLECS